MSINVYEIITQRIIQEMEKGNIPWRNPWTSPLRKAISHGTGKPYSLLNQWLLQYEGEYLTFKQVKDEGGRVIKGSKAEMVLFFKPYKIKSADQIGSEEEKIIPLLRYFNVFHISQCEGIEPKFPLVLSPMKFIPDEEAERVSNDYCLRENIQIRHRLQGDAYYSPTSDSITLPVRNQFVSSAEYYSTLFHELGHSTGAENRLNRFNTSSLLSESKECYSREELVAEISSSTILNTLGLETPSSFRNSVAYLQGWVKALNDDKRMIVSAASKAEKAVSLIMHAAPSDVPGTPDEIKINM